MSESESENQVVSASILLDEKIYRWLARYDWDGAFLLKIDSERIHADAVFCECDIAWSTSECTGIYLRIDGLPFFQFFQQIYTSARLHAECLPGTPNQPIRIYFRQVERVGLLVECGVKALFFPWCVAIDQKP